MKHSILDLCWENDLPRNPVVRRFQVINQESETPIIGQLPFYEQIPLVQADPNDILCFKNQTVHATKLTWYQTLDYYLLCYCALLAEKNGNEYSYIRLPYTIEEKLRNIWSRSKSLRKKLPFSLGKPTEEGKFAVSKYATGAILNSLYKSISIKSNAENVLNSLAFDGIMFSISEESATRLDWNLEDYFEHEWMTGVSLSIEIASILLEFEEDDMANNLLEIFSEEVLPTIVKSPMIFTRNTVARNFFQQVLFERELNRYNWIEVLETGRKSGNYDETIQRAILHSEILKNSPYFDLPDDEDGIEVAISHLRSLLSMVSLPVNIEEYITSPKYGLAMFCHPEHDNISYYLDQLQDDIRLLKHEVNPIRKKQTVSRRHRRKEDAIFMEVHKRVRKQIECKYQDNQR